MRGWIWKMFCLKLAQGFQGREKELKQQMPQERAKVVQRKNILLWEEMLVQHGYPDLGVVGLLKEGVDLSGQVPTTGVFEPYFKPSVMTPDQLSRRATATATESRDRVMSAASIPSELVHVIAEKTEAEVVEGWVSEPIDPLDLPWNTIVNKRFAIVQGDRPRVIDDCSASLLNDSVQKTESPKPQSTDLISSLCLYMLTVLPGLAMLGMCFDLKSAYRQVMVTHFFDDFVTFCREGEEQYLHGEVLFTNTKKRVDEVAAMLDKLVEAPEATAQARTRIFNGTVSAMMIRCLPCPIPRAPVNVTQGAV
eukprot:s3612_g3.t1